MVAIDFHSMEKKYLEVIGYTVNCLVTSNLQNIFFSVQQLKESGTSGKWVNGDRLFIWGWTIPLNTGGFERELWEYGQHF